ncbi:MAG: recombination-associated protein RdgC [Pseudomonadota bacterium]|nr:recombination-associated protein RdgC [Pseudomonadota bacterium]
MWFKSIQVLRLTPVAGQSADTLRDNLAKQTIGPCPGNVTQTHGWSSPFGLKSDELLVSVGPLHLAEFVLAKRLLPTDVVKQTLATRVAQLEDQQGGVPISKREQRRMQDEIHFELLPKAFVQQKSCQMFWHQETGFLYVGTTQTAMLEAISTSFAYCCPGWRLQTVSSVNTVENTLTSWLRGQDGLPKDFSWDDACQLLDPANRFATIRFSGNDLSSAGVRNHLQDGLQVKHAALVWRDQIRFVLNQNLALSQIKYLDIEKDHGADDAKEAIILADLALLGPIYHAWFTDLVQALGGEAQSGHTAALDQSDIIKEVEDVSLT